MNSADPGFTATDMNDHRGTQTIEEGAAEPVRQFFLSNMSARAAKMLMDDMAAMGPVRLREVDEAQGLLVNLAKDLAAKGEIVISKTRGEEELIY